MIEPRTRPCSAACSGAKRLRLLLPLLIPAVAAANQSAAQAAVEERAKLIAALERLMLTGEPLHASHGEGAWLQAAVKDCGGICRGY